ncbi:MAG: hypothetical protein Q8L54_05230 [Devosia sp.]|nr:hypothetical protein [Devosia sp.]
MRYFDEIEPTEIDQWLKRARRELTAHARQVRLSPASDEPYAAIDAILAELQDLALAHPGKQKKIGKLIDRFHASRERSTSVSRPVSSITSETDELPPPPESLVRNTRRLHHFTGHVPFDSRRADIQLKPARTAQ